MKYSVACALAAVAVGVNAQGAPAGLAPSGSAPTGCQSSGSGTYEVTIVKPAAAAKRDLEKRAACGTDALVVSLNNGVLTDKLGRIGSIVANRQFQFDGPPAQTGAIYDAGWSFCPNTSIALGPTTDFYQCLSGSFYNLYDQPSETNCSLVKMNIQACDMSTTGGSSSMGSSAGSVSQTTDGQPQATSPATVSQQSDGQPTASSAVSPVSQISDGQPQATGASNATTTGSPPVQTGAAASYAASGAFVVVGAIAAFFL